MRDDRTIKDFWDRRDGLARLSAEALLRETLKVFGDGALQANSLGAEDVVVAHMLSEIDPAFRSFTLDTGRLNPETLELLQRLEERLGARCEVFFPDAAEIEAMVRERGINLFYASVENRKLCCEIRKLRPLNRALSGRSAWICGLRREQSAGRAEVGKIEIDAAHGGILKINPLADWSRERVWDYIKSHSLPYNRLHDSGYPSIGCAPCTRAVRPGEPERAGRWWWEAGGNQECGLHRGK